MKIRTLVMMVLILASAVAAKDSSAAVPIGIDEKIGAMLPLDLKFYNEDGYLVALKDVIKKPTILNFVYYKCPGICSPIMTELATIVDHMDMTMGKDYQIVTISFDERETPDLAKAKKESYMALLDTPIPPWSWTFMTGDSATIHTLTDAAGFMFRREGDQFVHSGAVIAISPQGKIARYLYGTQYLPFDVKMALTEASEGRTGPTIAKILAMCYSYNPEGRTYVFNVTRVAGGIILVFTAGIVVYFSVRPKKKTKA